MAYARANGFIQMAETLFNNRQNTTKARKGIARKGTNRSGASVTRSPMRTPYPIHIIQTCRARYNHGMTATAYLPLIASGNYSAVAYL